MKLLNYTKSGKPFWNLLTVRGGRRPAQHRPAQRSNALNSRTAPVQACSRRNSSMRLPCLAKQTRCAWPSAPHAAVHLHSCTAHTRRIPPANSLPGRWPPFWMAGAAPACLWAYW